MFEGRNSQPHTDTRMQLILDMGNSTIVAALMKNGEVIHSIRIPSDREKPQDFFEKALSPLHKFTKRCGVTMCVLSSVVPELNDTLLAAAQTTFRIPKEGMKGLITDEMISHAITMDVDNPSAVGKDRICDCVGALAYHITSNTRWAIVIDMGTATTVNVIIPKTQEEGNIMGTFLGGQIIPGVRTSLNALSKKASLLPEVRIEAPSAIIGKSTVQAMQSGIVYGHAAMIDGIIDRMKEEMKNFGVEDLKIVATGGMAIKIVPHCRHEIEYDEHLLLKGLSAIVNLI